jgi:hypothetical protein
MLAGVTPSDASHVLGRLSAWDGAAAEKALALMARRRRGDGERIAADAAGLAQAIIDRLTAQTVDCLLEAALAEDPRFDGEAGLVGHPLLRAGLDGHRGLLSFDVRLDVPVVGLGASAPAYYGAVGERLRCAMVLPEHAGVANAIGAVVGQVAQRMTGIVTSPAEGRFVAHLPDGVQTFSDLQAALASLRAALADEVAARALRAGAAEAVVTLAQDVQEVEIEGRRMFVEARVTATAAGRPRVARDAA